MKKTNLISKIIITAFISLLLLLTFVGDVVGSGYNVDLNFYEQSQDSVSISNLDVEVVVSKNNIANVTEKFDVTFNKPKLSEVIRYVPYASYVYHQTENGVEKNIRYSKIYDITGSGEFGESCNVYKDEENGFLTIGLKSAEGYFHVDETRSYLISYKMDMGKDANKGFDEVYFNIVGTNSLLTVENIQFRVTLPEDTAEAKSLNVYYGKDGSTKTLDVNSSGELVTGTLDKLGPCEGITIRAVYEDGFLSHDKEIFASQIVSVVAAMIGVVLALVIMFKFTQRKNYPRPVEVVAPEGVNPLNADYYLNGECTEKAIPAGIVYLASKGYLKIKQHDDKKIELIKLKDADDQMDTSVNSLFNAIFTAQNDSVMLDDLSVSFFTKAKTIRGAVKAKTETVLYDQKNKKTRNLMLGFSLVAFVVAFIAVFAVSVEYFGFMSQIFIFDIIKVVFIFIFTAYILTAKGHFIFKYICGVFIILFAIGFYIHVGYSLIDQLWLGFVAIILLASIPILAEGESLYSNDGKMVKGRIEGFKDFILKCEVSQLKMFAEENPTYYFDVLPYAYIFGLSDVWMDKFKSIEVTIPDWVEVENVDIVDMIMFNSMFNHFMMTSHTNFVKSGIAMAKTSSSSFGGGSFGGGFGGGGFSGGGFGGGGGGRW